jgi:anti-anti-sigma factor
VSAAPIGIDVRIEGGRLTLVTLDGDLDCVSADALSAALERLGGRGEWVLLDAGAVGFVDSAGLRALVAARQRFGARLVVIHASPQLRHLVRITGLQDVLALPESVALERGNRLSLLQPGGELIT